METILSKEEKIEAHEKAFRKYIQDKAIDEETKLLNFMSTRIIFGEGLYTKGSLVDYTITYIKELENNQIPLCNTPSNKEKQT